MTERGYELAQWMYRHRDNLLVVALYASLFILFILAVEISTYSSEPAPRKLEQRLSNDYESTYRR